MASAYRFQVQDSDTFSFYPPPEAPTFRPTAEDFENPLEYINKIKPEAERYGICKIKPPMEWQPPFAMDIKNFRFTPRIQNLNELEARTRTKLNFIEKVAKYWKLQGYHFKIPVVCGKQLDMYVLYHLVEEYGGYNNVCEHNRWIRIANNLALTSNYDDFLRKVYERYLLSFSMFSQKTTPDMNPKDCTLIPGKEEDIILRYADDEVKKNIENAMKLSGNGDEPLSFLNLNERKKRPIMVENENKKITAEPSNAPSINDLDPMAKYLCMNCELGDDEESMLLCDGCDDSYHTFCLSPPLLEIPTGDWRCPFCVTKELCIPPEAYGFEQSTNSYTLGEFGEKADAFKAEYFESAEVSTQVVEEAYWQIVSSIDPLVSVEYGADLHTVEHGSGFPSKQTVCLSRDPQAPKYLESPWNLNNLPVCPSSVLGFIKADISGMKVPWMYVGMCFSTFCWHNEDHWSYSINYLHWGEPKTWYGIPGRYADEFERVIKMAAPELFNEHPDLLHQLTTTLNPNVLMAEGVPVFRTDQQAGEFVITFPRAYHAGFNQGYNFAEAVNFAPLDWVPVGRKCVEYYSLMKRENVFSHDELIIEIALKVDEIDALTALTTYKEMLIICEQENKFRRELLNWGVKYNELYLFEIYPDDVRQCDFCKTTCYLSCVGCRCKRSSQKIACFRHYRQVCNCSPANHVLRYRWKVAELYIFANKLENKVKASNTLMKFMKEKRAVFSKGSPLSLTG